MHLTRTVLTVKIETVKVKACVGMPHSLSMQRTYVRLIQQLHNGQGTRRVPALGVYSKGVDNPRLFCVACVPQ